MSVFNRLLVTGLPAVPKPIVGRVASRYVAGESLDAAVRVIRTLNGQGAMATVDLLGEEVDERAKATAAVAEYLQIFETLDREKVDSNVSIKLTLLGLKIDEGFCRDNVAQIVETAKRFGNFVRIDMEDHTTTDATLRIYRELHARFGNLGVVLQAYMRRTLRDIEELPAEGASVRLCKGIYVEPRQVAWKGYDTVRHNYVQALDKLLSPRRLRRHRDARRVPRLRGQRPGRQARPEARPVRVPDAAGSRRGIAQDPDRGRAPAAGLRSLRARLVSLFDPPPAREPRGRPPCPARRPVRQMMAGKCPANSVRQMTLGLTLRTGG